MVSILTPGTLLLQQQCSCSKAGSQSESFLAPEMGAIGAQHVSPPDQEYFGGGSPRRRRVLARRTEHAAAATTTATDGGETSAGLLRLLRCSAGGGVAARDRDCGGGAAARARDRDCGGGGGGGGGTVFESRYCFSRRRMRASFVRALAAFCASCLLRRRKARLAWNPSRPVILQMISEWMSIFSCGP